MDGPLVSVTRGPSKPRDLPIVTPTPTALCHICLKVISSLILPLQKGAVE